MEGHISLAVRPGSRGIYSRERICLRSRERGGSYFSACWIASVNWKTGPHPPPSLGSADSASERADHLWGSKATLSRPLLQVAGQ